MKKQTLLCLALTVCVAVAAVVGFAVYKIFEKSIKNDYKTGLNSDVVFECAPEEITGFSVKNEKEEYTLEKNEEWQIAGLEEKRLEKKAVEDTVLLLSSVKGNKLDVMSFDGQEINFDKKLTVYSAKQSESFCFAEDNKKFYLKNSKGNIFEVSQVFYSIGERSVNFYRSKSFAQIEMFNSSNFVSFEYNPGTFNGFYDRVVIRLKNEKENQMFNENSEYIMESPFYKSVDTGAFDAFVLAKLSAFKAEDFVAEAPKDLEKFGLDEKQRGELCLKTDKGEFTLFIGTHTSDSKPGEVYAMFLGDTSVFTVLLTNAGFAFTDPVDYIEKSLCDYNLDYLSKAEVDFGEKRCVFENRGEKYYINQKPLSDKAFLELKEKLAMLSASNEADGKYETPYAEIKVTVGFGKTLEYKIYKTENRKYIVCEKDGICRYLEEEGLNEFLSCLKKLGV